MKLFVILEKKTPSKTILEFLFSSKPKDNLNRIVASFKNTLNMSSYPHFNKETFKQFFLEQIINRFVQPLCIVNCDN